jgi:boron transporter
MFRSLILSKPVCDGIKSDLLLRLPLYLSDFSNFLNLKVLASILFIFFTSLGPAITFSTLLQSETDRNIGTVEVMLSSAITGIIFSLFSGQPLVIVGVTGPVSILTISIYSMATSWNINFIQFYGWSQLWAGFFIILLAIFNFCSFIPLITRYCCEIFGVLIAVIYLYTGIGGIVSRFNGRDNMDSTLLQIIITLGTAWLSLQLSYGRTWTVFNHKIRDLISDYGPTIALIIWTGIPYIGYAGDISIDTLDVPSTFETTSGRAWVVPLGNLPVWAIFAAILPGFITTVLFLFDHNVSSLLAQAPEFRLKKGSAYHWDFFVVGVNLIVTGILGLPPTNGLIPQAPLHVASLLKTKRLYDPITEKSHVEVIKVYEQRISNLSQSALMLAMCFQPFLGILKLIPNSALDGLFIYMGLASFSDNQFAERMLLLITEKRLRRSPHPFFHQVHFGIMKRFTLLQAAICAVIFVITLTPGAMVFPVLIGVLIPFRQYSLSSIFPPEAVELLDPPHKEILPEDSSDEEDEVMEVKSQSSDGGDEEDVEGEAGMGAVVAAGERRRGSRGGAGFELVSVAIDS